jgi:hypothetical protein
VLSENPYGVAHRSSFLSLHVNGSKKNYQPPATLSMNTA